MATKWQRRRFLNWLGPGLTGIALVAATRGQAQADQPVRIGFQKFGLVSILRARGTLEPRLRDLGTEVQWTEFSAGPQLLEAMNVGSIDFGHAGEAPPIFAQAAGTPLVYAASGLPNPAAEAILVPGDSPLQTVSELKGKTVVLNKGSNVHYLLVRVLEQANVAYTDIETVFLPPADARVAFESNDVDAWTIWDPFWLMQRWRLEVGS